MLFIQQKSLWRALYVACATLTITVGAFGAVKIYQTALPAEMDGMDKDQIIATLKEDIKTIDEQMAQCKKQKKGWTAATVIGGIGIVGTGIGAIVQSNQVKDKKTELKNAQDELRSLQ